jgi:GNAT superfamily N-acetyltransferase
VIAGGRDGSGFRRLTLVAQLARRDVTLPIPVRHPTDDDLPELARAMFEAYRGGVDDSGETIADAEGSIRTLFASGFGTPLLECSFVALDGTTIVAVTLVTVFEGRPLLAQAYTVPAWQNRGLARALIQLCENALLDRGESVLALAVTVGNLPALHLYASMGFVFEGGRT